MRPVLGCTMVRSCSHVSLSRIACFPADLADTPSLLGFCTIHSEPCCRNTPQSRCPYCRTFSPRDHNDHRVLSWHDARPPLYPMNDSIQVYADAHIPNYLCWGSNGDQNSTDFAFARTIHVQLGRGLSPNFPTTDANATSRVTNNGQIDYGADDPRFNTHVA